MDEIEDRLAALEYVLVTFLAGVLPPEADDALKKMAEERRIHASSGNVTMLRPEYHGIPSPVVDRIQALFDRLKWARPSK